MLATRKVFFSIVWLVGLAFPPVNAQSPMTTRLASNGQATWPIIHAPNSSARTRKSAHVLAEYLGKISEAQFEVKSGDGSSGITVGLASDFPALASPKPLQSKAPTVREDYWLHSHEKGLHVLGATELALEHAIWDLLRQLGYRQFFPGPTWEVIPHQRDLALALDRLEHPSYYARRIWYGYGAGSWAAQPYADWCAKNRVVNGIEVQSGHAYDAIAARHRAEFAQHPEYRGLVGGERKSPQFCISNPGLRQLVVQDSLQQLAKFPARQCLSLEPADGGGWCECAQCKKMGSVTDRVITLANEVAAAVQAQYPDKYAALYAYNQHSPPPTIPVHPRVIVNVATAFITDGYSIEQLMVGWQKQGTILGIREYYSVHPWDRDLPGKARGSNSTYLQRTLPHFHQSGARFLSAESSDNWGCNGLGYYLAACMLWDVREAKNLDALQQDFFTRAFGPAQKPIAEFYRLIDGKNRPLLTDDLLGRMYRQLDQARRATEDASIRGRIDDLILYTRYVELWSDYAASQGQDRQPAFETLVKHALRIRKTMMIHTLGLVRDLPRRDKTVKQPAGVARGFTAATNPWLNDAPIQAEEIFDIVANGIARRKRFDFEPVAFSGQLIPATKLRLPAVKTGSAGLYTRGVTTYQTWIDTAPAELSLQIKAGIIYQNRGDATLALLPQNEVEGKSVSDAKISPDKEDHAAVLKTTYSGLHQLEISDHGCGTKVTWPENMSMTVVSSPEAPANLHGRWSLYFYVPKGTRQIGGYASGVGDLLDGGGKKVFTFDKKPAYFSVPVPAGQDGRLWKFQNSAGQRLLMTVPPCLARNERELLLPREIVERDAGAK